MFFNFSLARAARASVAAFAIRGAKCESIQSEYFTRRASGASEACLAPVMLLCLLVVPNDFWTLRLELCSLTHDACQNLRASVAGL